METKYSKKAILSFIFGICSWLPVLISKFIPLFPTENSNFLLSALPGIVCFIFWIFALRFGMQSHYLIKSSEGKLKGEWMASIGRVLGALGIGIVVVATILIVIIASGQVST